MIWLLTWHQQRKLIPIRKNYFWIWKVQNPIKQNYDVTFALNCLNCLNPVFSQPWIVSTLDCLDPKLSQPWIVSILNCLNPELSRLWIVSTLSYLDSELSQPWVISTLNCLNPELSQALNCPIFNCLTLDCPRPWIIDPELSHPRLSYPKVSKSHLKLLKYQNYLLVVLENTGVPERCSTSTRRVLKTKATVTKYFDRNSDPVQVCQSEGCHKFLYLNIFDCQKVALIKSNQCVLRANI